MTRRTRNVLMVLAAVVAVGVACDTTEEEQYTANVTLTNNGSQDVHLLGPGESMSAENRVAPGASRTYFLVYTPGDAVTFRTERPEGELGRVTCTAGGIVVGASAAWNGSAMTCAGW